MSEPIAAFDTSERRAILNNMVDREHPAVQAIMKLVEENRQLRLVIAGLSAVRDVGEPIKCNACGRTAKCAECSEPAQGFPFPAR